MPKQTIDFIRQLPTFGINHGCLSNIMGNEQSVLANDVGYINTLIRTAKSIKCDLKKKAALYIRIQKAVTNEGMICTAITSCSLII